MNTGHWVSLIVCVGELAVAVLVGLRALGSPLAIPLMALSIDLLTWNFAQLAYHRSGAIQWHLLDMLASPLGMALAFHFMLRFLGLSPSRFQAPVDGTPPVPSTIGRRVFAGHRIA